MASLRRKVDTLEQQKDTLEENLSQIELKLEEETKKCENYKQKWSRADAQRMSLKTLHNAQLREQKKQNGNKSSEENELLQLREEKKSNKRTKNLKPRLETQQCLLSEPSQILTSPKSYYLVWH